MKWSPMQQAVFEYVETRREPLVVQAYAGTGKTTTLVETLNHVPDYASVFVGAFNKKIAKELEARVPAHVRDPARVKVRTLHGLGYVALLRAWSKLNPKLDEDGTARDRMLADGVLDRTFTPEERGEVFKLLAMAKKLVIESDDDLVDAMSEFECYPEEKDPLVYCKAVRTMLARSREPSSVISFDDMVYLPAVLNLRTGQYDWVFIDETQDMNRAQLMVAKRALRSRGTLVAVGDENQAIYGWNGADTRAMGDMVADLHANLLPLSVTYRCPRAVVAEANRYVPDLVAAPEAPEGEVREVDEDHMKAHWRPGDFVVSRTNAALVALVLWAMTRGVAVRMEGRDVGAGLAKFVKGADCADVPEFLAWLNVHTIDEAKRLDAAGKTRQVDALFDRREALIALSEGVKTIPDLVAKIRRVFDAPVAGEAVVLLTTHKAKGLEAERVWLLRDTYKPERSQEDKNLYYVAVTRAKSRLYLVRGDVRHKR